MKMYENHDNDFVAAARDGRIDEVRRRLADGADPNIPNVAGGQAICQAAEGGFLELVELLLESGAHPNARDDDGDLFTPKTALMCAATRGHVEIVERLLKAGAEINLQDQNGQTALIWAVGYGRAVVVERLLDAGADLNIEDEFGATALGLAEDPKIAQLLRARGAEGEPPSDEAAPEPPEIPEGLAEMYFARAMTWDASEEGLTVFDTVTESAPRILTMDQWPSFVFQSALGDMPVSDFCRRSEIALYGGDAPEGLSEMLTAMVARLAEDGLITLAAEPMSLPIYLEKPRSEVEPEVYEAAMRADGFAGDLGTDEEAG